MRVLCDTSVLVEVDRQRAPTVEILHTLLLGGDTPVISTITVAEILTGTYLVRDPKAAARAKAVLGQFEWKDVDGATADVIAKFMATRMVEKKQDQVEYPDIGIGATRVTAQCDAILTMHEKDFVLLPG